MDAKDFLLFLGSLAIAYTVPGPDMIFVLQVGARRGRLQALLGAVGLAAARASHVAFAAIGLATLFRTAPWSFEIVRLIGAAYLVWLGIGILRSRSLVPRQESGSIPAGLHNDIVLRGFLTNLLNPKPLLFCSVLLPQFVHSDDHGIFQQFALLGVVLVTVGFAVDVFLAVCGASLGRWLAHHPTAQDIQRYAFGTILIGFAADLSLMHAPG
jgi:threonine/homoserine/homoserine lactone efflux protein